MDYVRLGVYAAAVTISFILGATINGYRWESKYARRELDWQTELAEANAKALAEQKAMQLAQEKIVDDYEKRLFDINNRPPSTRVIRVCGLPASSLGVSTADSPGLPGAAPADRGADQGTAGTVLDPGPIFDAAARCDAQLNALIDWAQQ